MSKLLLIPGFVLIGLVLGLVGAAIGSVFVLVGFNHGVVPLVHAFHGSVDTIGFWTAFWTAFALTTLGSLTKGASVNAG